MQQVINISHIVIILLCCNITTFAQLTIEQSEVYKDVHQQNTVTLPRIVWKSPARADYKSSNKIQHLEACIMSQEKPSNMALYINGRQQNFRDFNIIPINNGCDYTWKASLSFNQIGRYSLDLYVTNSAGKTHQSCIIEITNSANVVIQNNNNNKTLGNRYALVIGNSAYAEKPLINPTNDAEDMTVRLRQLGFSVDTYKNLDKRQTINAVNTFSNKIRKNDIALFFYAGHGYQINGVSYLLPIGYSIASAADAEYEGYRLDRILGNMQEAGAAVNLMFLDACRNNPIRSVLSRTLNNGGGLAFPKTQPSGSLIAFATLAGSVASDGSGRNGSYTSALLSYLQKGQSINDILTLVTGKVKRETAKQQIPEYKSSLDNIFRF